MAVRKIKIAAAVDLQNNSDYKGRTIKSSLFSSRLPGRFLEKYIDVLHKKSEWLAVII